MKTKRSTHLADEHHVLISPYGVGWRLPKFWQSVMVERVFQTKNDYARENAAAQHEENAQKRVDTERRGLSDVRCFHLAMDTR